MKRREGQDELLLTRCDLECDPPDLLQNPPNTAVRVSDRQFLPISACQIGFIVFFARSEMRRAKDVSPLIFYGRNKLNRWIEIPRSP